MGILKEEDIQLIKRHAANVTYGKIILDIKKGSLIKIEHQDAEYTKEGFENKNSRKGNGNGI